MRHLDWVSRHGSGPFRGAAAIYTEKHGSDRSPSTHFPDGLIVHCSDDRLAVKGDPVRLAQILSNLLSNSTKYTERGGTITLTVERDGDAAVIKVTDTGIGIPPGSLENVFEMFSQVRVHQARSDGGLGIGLALVRSLVEMHGGSVIADSRGVGTGSTFTVRLPTIRNAASISSHSRIP
jgi:signal transduction histidine kinase